MGSTEWLLPALGASTAIGVHYLLLRAASGRIGDALGALVLESAAALGVAAMFAVRTADASVPTTKWGVLFSILSGLAVSIASILLFAALRRGGPVAATGTIVLGGGVTLSALFGTWIFSEAITTRRVVGVALGLAAIVVLSSESPR